MKFRLEARWGILLLLAVFGLLIAAATVLAVRVTRHVSLLNESDALREDLKIIAGEISATLDDDEDANDFSFLELTARIERNERNFSYVLRDESGLVLSPSFVAGKTIDMDDVYDFSEDGSSFLADVWGERCFVVRYAFPDKPLELLGIYNNQYVFGDVHYTIRVFIIVLSCIFLILMLLAWLWIIPDLERVLERKRRAEKELEVAGTLQQKAVTKVFPQDARCQVHAVLLPARIVGGDIYRCRVIGDKLFFAVGDVSDKGMAAAHVMFLLSSVIQSHSMDKDSSLVHLMEEVNALLVDNPEYDMFCTLFMGTIDLDTHEFEFCNAGHTKAVLNGAFLDQDPQLIAGIVRDYPYRTQTIRLEPGSRLLLYTDGVTEARNADGAFFGERRLLDWVRAQDPSAPCEKTCSDLLASLGTFRGKARQNDDIAIMCIKI